MVRTPWLTFQLHTTRTMWRDSTETGTDQVEKDIRMPSWSLLSIKLNQSLHSAYLNFSRSSITAKISTAVSLVIVIVPQGVWQILRRLKMTSARFLMLLRRSLWLPRHQYLVTSNAKRSVSVEDVGPVNRIPYRVHKPWLLCWGSDKFSAWLCPIYEAARGTPRNYNMPNPGILILLLVHDSYPQLQSLSQ